jgi:hypothetical protein
LREIGPEYQRCSLQYACAQEHPDSQWLLLQKRTQKIAHLLCSGLKWSLMYIGTHCDQTVDEDGPGVWSQHAHIADLAEVNSGYAAAASTG